MAVITNTTRHVSAGVMVDPFDVDGSACLVPLHGEYPGRSLILDPGATAELAACLARLAPAADQPAEDNTSRTRRVTLHELARLERAGLAVERVGRPGDQAYGWTLVDRHPSTLEAYPDGATLMVAGHGGIVPHQWQAVAEGLERLDRGDYGAEHQSAAPATSDVLETLEDVARVLDQAVRERADVLPDTLALALQRVRYVRDTLRAEGRTS